MRQGRRQCRFWLFVRFMAVGFLCVAGRGASAQSPGVATSVPQPPNAWTTGGVSGTAAPNGGQLPYWQAPALPSAVIQGGAIPTGWTPQTVPYQGIGPDGRPLTMYYSPTYVFTYQIGPPVLAAAAVPNPSQVNRRQAMPMATQPASMQGWNYATQGVPAVPYTLPPATVARYQPTPYQYPAGAKALSGTPIVPPSGMPQAVAPATTYATTPPSLTAPPGQWTPSAEPPPAGLMPQTAALASATPPAAAGDALAAAAPPMVAGSAAAIAAATGAQANSAAPSAFSPIVPIAPGSTPAQPVSVSSSQQPTSLSAGPHLWRVVGVHDGDTVTCLDESNQQQKVRLAEIDAPEIGQDYGKVSREVLAEMVFGKTVEVTEDGKDRYGRWIGHLSSNGVDVNRQMIATGNAWHYADYSRDTSLAALQTQAQAQRLGLWAQPSPVAPWDFRKSGQP